jgi:sucrose-6-phosphate hydrolase SacC (GH32 family)
MTDSEKCSLSPPPLHGRSVGRGGQRRPRGRLLAAGLTIALALSGAACRTSGGPATNDASASYDEPYRPQYHFTPPTGWIGDPSGLVYEGGRYHLFYWGHAVSRDLVHWEHWPRALRESDGVGVMSGSVVVDSANTSGFGSAANPPMVAIYSGFHHADRRQTQDIAYSLDGGRTWTKYAGNPVIDIGSTEFRDPQVFWYEPDGRWLMVVALAEEMKVRFYASDDLKEWTFLSDFGPAGAVNGVWECPDIFPLPVDGDPDRIKWVLQVDVQPTGGQYFVGDFDGTTFRADDHFRGVIEASRAVPPGILFEDFEGEDYVGWTVSGEAFGEGPATGKLPGQNPVLGFQGRGLVNSFLGGDDPHGMLTSAPFEIEKPYINFLIGGGTHPEETSIDLLIDGHAVRRQTGTNTEALQWASWDVRDLTGREAVIRIVDRKSGGWGHILVDHIMFAEAPADPGGRVPAHWIDYGNDFYAVRSWHGAPNDHPRVWIAWMSNWQYAQDTPTSPWQGQQSIPRELSLHEDASGKVFLAQRPLDGLQVLRDKHTHLSSRELREGEVDLTADGIRGTSLEVVAEFEPGDASAFGLLVRRGADEETVIAYDIDRQELYLDRTRSGDVGFSPNFPGIHAGPLMPDGGRIRLHVFVDRTSVEVFGNDGRIVISDLIFPDPSSDGLALFTRGGTVRLVSLDVWELASIWE